MFSIVDKCSLFFSLFDLETVNNAKRTVTNN
jgi:hypothetical protein